MSRGLGWVQAACLEVLREHQNDEEPLTTYDIAGWVYQVKPDADNVMIVDDAPYVATKRALEGLRRKGLVASQCPGNYRAGRSHRWRLTSPGTHHGAWFDLNALRESERLRRGATESS